MVSEWRNYFLKVDSSEVIFGMKFVTVKSFYTESKYLLKKTQIERGP